MSDYIIKMNKVVKSYGNSFALNKLNMNVPQGSVYGLLGKNGAGKTTALRICMSLLKITSGNVNVLGVNPWNMPINIKQDIGYSSDSMQLIPWLKVADILSYNGSFYKNWDKEYVNQWVKRLNLSLDKRVFQLSRGNRQKLALAMAIGHKPKLLILDEPAGGLDPVARKEFLESIIELIHESGTTILISSHSLDDLERISDYIGIIENGSMKLETNLEDLKDSTKQVTIFSSKSIENFSNNNLIYSESKNNQFTGIFKNWNDESYSKLKEKFPDSNIEVNSMKLEDIFLAYNK
ncbi:MAG: ABC transporter ATP-binding protein [Candidatus Sericytochromatia bacterium]